MIYQNRPTYSHKSSQMKVRSIILDTWDPEQIQVMEKNGNIKVNERLEFCLTPGFFFFFVLFVFFCFVLFG